MNKKNLEEIRSQGEKSASYITVGMSACGIAAGAEEVFKVFAGRSSQERLPIQVNKCGCIGMCYAEPLYKGRRPASSNGKVNRSSPDIEKHVAGKTLINDLIYGLKANE